MATACDSGVDTEGESYTEDSSNSLPPIPNNEEADGVRSEMFSNVVLS